ncbi:MAG TPA: pitrilysin family protein [Puia sp.]|jgi:zinc protease|nr:pitrilysin family protein [Puia sp.]
MKTVAITCLVVLTAFYAFSQPKAPASPAMPEFVTSVEGVKEYRLSNGLQILLVPDPAQTNVVVNVVYHVGSRQEGYGETGMAHLLEHMMFRPSKKFTSIKQTIGNKGAFANGQTSYDRTDYFEVLPASDSNLIWALDMESDRMVNSLMRDEDLKKEFTVVRNEFEAGENQPDQILQERILATMYLWHNYGKSPIGSKEDIERVPISALAAFYRKYYQPDNATLIIGGKFDEKKTLALIQSYFAKIPRPARVLTPPYTVEPPQDGERYVELRRNGDIPFIGMAFHTPAGSDKDYVANDAVIEILTNDPAGYFYKQLVETKLATKEYGWSLTSYDPGFTYFGLSVPKDKSLDSAKAAFLAAADHLLTLTITQEDVDRAKNSLKKQVSDMQNNTLNFSIGLADIIGAGDWRLWYIYRDRLDQLTLADVQACLKKYYLTSNRTVGVFIPDKSAERVVVAERPDVAALVKGYKGRATMATAETGTFEANIPNIKKSTEYGAFSNGMRYALLKKPVKGDKIYANFILKIGDENSLTGKNSIPMLTAAMLKTGTTTRSKKDINDQLDKLKSSIAFGSSAGGSTISVNVVTDKDNCMATLDLLSDMLLHPAFDPNEFSKLLIDIGADLDQSRSDPQNVAVTTCRQKMTSYPKGHPLYPEGPDEEAADLKAAKLEDIRAFYNDFYGADHGYVSFVGDIDAAAIKGALEKSLASYKSKKTYAPIEQKNAEVKGGTQSIVIADKKNATLYGGINISLKESDPDYVALEIANEMLGGGAFISSRVANRLRENEGMSYGAGTFCSASYNYPVCTWGVYAIFNPMYKNRLDSAFKDEVNKALQGGFTADELKKAVTAWLGSHKTLLGVDRYLAFHQADYLEKGKDLSFDMGYEDKAKALTVDQVNAVLRKYISPEKMTLVYAGDFK